MVNIRLYSNLKFIRDQICYVVLKSQSLNWVVGNYIRDVSICEQCILQVHGNHLFFCGNLWNQNYVVTTICTIVWSYLDIMAIIMWYFGERFFGCPKKAK